MPKQWKIDGLPERRQIQQEMGQGISNRRIGEKYHIAESTVREYRKTRLPQVLAAHEKARDLATAGGIIERVKDVLERMLKAADAADVWLTDPENPNKYTLDPRADEVMVVYYEKTPRGKLIRHKARLQALLNRVSKGLNISVGEVYIKHADPRDILLKTSDRIYSGLELVARIQGQVKDTQINVVITPAWILTKNLVLKVLQNNPEAMREFNEGVHQILIQDEQLRRSQ